MTNTTETEKTYSMRFDRAACDRYGIGITNLKKLAEDAGAVIRINKKIVLLNVRKMDEYMDSITK